MPTATPASGLAGRRILVVCEPGRSGRAAIDYARQLAEDNPSTVTVVGVAPQAPVAPRCGCAPVDFNAAIRDAAADELEQARQQLKEIGDRTAFELLVEGADPPLEAWSAAAGFDLILLPARRRPLRARAHPQAAALRRTGAEVRVVDPRARPDS
jgi:nucleotide-binding universal stress UspA family protein